MERLDVALGERSYEILIDGGLLARAGELIGPLLPRPYTVIVTDRTVADLHLADLQSGLAAAGIASEAVILPPGEATKSMAHLTGLVERLLALKIERDDLVIAFGGGVIGDLAGFAAAVLRRGIGFVQVPTTLLAQVDSSVGGKTGVNSPHGKNLIGAFHQPRLVLADIDVLGTLDRRDFLAGYGEVAKYGLLGDADFFTWLEENGPALADGDAALRARAVLRCCQMKADIVARDETERGDRALLNLGHTFGHALEAATGYSDRLLHGEGVAIGCALAFETSARLSPLPAGDAKPRARPPRRHGDEDGPRRHPRRPARRGWADRADVPGQEGPPGPPDLHHGARDRRGFRHPRSRPEGGAGGADRRVGRTGGLIP